jgi:phosphate:Na+ symporter
VKLLYHLVPEVEGQITYGPRYLNKLLLETPEAAFAALYKEVQHCHEVATLMVKQIFQSVFENDRAPLPDVLKEEDILNNLQSELISYVVLLSKQRLDIDQSQQIPAILHIVGDAERIGDHAKDMVELAHNKTEEKIIFSEEAHLELHQIQEQMLELAGLAQKALEYQEENPQLLNQAKSLEYSIKHLTEQGRMGHMTRLEVGSCTVRAGILYMDILSHLERISEHYANMVRRGSDDSKQIA